MSILFVQIGSNVLIDDMQDLIAECTIQHATKQTKVM